MSLAAQTTDYRFPPKVPWPSAFPAYTTRATTCPRTVCARTTMVLGALLHEPNEPGWFLPITGRLYFRRSQLPAGPEGTLAFRTKCELAVELLRAQARIAPGHKHLGVVDGGYALE